MIEIKILIFIKVRPKNTKKRLEEDIIRMNKRTALMRKINKMVNLIGLRVTGTHLTIITLQLHSILRQQETKKMPLYHKLKRKILTTSNLSCRVEGKLKCRHPYYLRLL